MQNKIDLEGYEIINLPFSPKFHWRFKNSVIEPVICRDHWYKYLYKKQAQILMPGYLLEVLTSIMAVDILKSEKKIEITSFITPSYYADLLDFFKIKVCCGRNDDPVKEYNRISEAVNAYPSPVFLNQKNDIYFNLLNNYGGNIKTVKGTKVERLNKPFWKQILQNTCCTFTYPVLPKFSKEDLFKVKHKLYKQHDIFNKYVLLDNSNIFGVTADNRVVKNKLFLQAEIDDLANKLSKHKIKCVVLGPDMNFTSTNVVRLDPWIYVNSLDLLTFMLYAECIISSDPNIYLSAALLDCRKVVCLDDPPEGWTFDDLPNVNSNNIWHKPKFVTNDYLCDLTVRGY